MGPPSDPPNVLRITFPGTFGKPLLNSACLFNQSFAAVTVGTNTFHGALYEQNRPTVTAANDWFNKQAELSNGLPNVPGKVIRNTFGGSLGGPIKKDRLFFFGTYEGQRLAENQQVQKNVPSPNLQDGVVLYPCAPVLNPDGTVSTPATTVCPGGTNGLPPVVGLSGKVYSFAPGTSGVGPAQIAAMDNVCSTVTPVHTANTCPLGPGANPLAGNAQGTGVFQQYPAANSSPRANAAGFNVSCFSFSAPNPRRLNTTIVKLDYNLTPPGTHRLFLRATYQTHKTAN